MLRPFVLAVCVIASTPWLAAGQAVKVQFQMGKVTLTATNAPLRAVLTEWARVGGTRIVNPERLTGGPVTLELTNVPERQALDILLRDIGGFMLGPRTALVPGVSAYDRLIIVSGSAGRPTTTAPPAFTPAPQPQRRVPPPFEPPSEPLDEQNDIDPDAPTSVVPRPGRPGGPQPPGIEPTPSSQPGTPPRGNPFGPLSGTTRPGVIQPAAPAAPQDRTPNEQ